MGYDRKNNCLCNHCTCNDPCNPGVLMHIDDNYRPCHCNEEETCDSRMPEHCPSCKDACHSHKPEQESCDCGCPDHQLHVHEIQGSDELAEYGKEAHNHRFATVTGEARYIGSSHVHNVRFRTDYHDDHYHEAWGTTGPAIQVGDSHVHFLFGITTVEDGHLHRYRASTMIEDPIR